MRQPAGKAWACSGSHVHVVMVARRASPAHRATGRIPGSVRRRRTWPGVGRDSTLGRSGQIRLPDDPPAARRAVPSGREDGGGPAGQAPAAAGGAAGQAPAAAGGAAGQAPAAAGGAAGRAPAAAPGAGTGPGARRRAGRGQRGLAAAVPGPAAPAMAGPVARRRPGPPAHLAPVQARGDRPGHRGRASRLRQDRVRVRAVPARAGDRVLHDHRPSWTDLALDRLPAGGGGHRGLGGLARPRPAIRHHLPGDDLPHRRGGGPAQPVQAGQHPGGAEPGRPRRGGSSTVNRRRPPSASGSGSLASCTTWWPTTSA